MGSNQSSLALTLKLSGKGIKNLETDVKHPHLLPAFTKLELIDLSKNKIPSIPASIQADVLKSSNVIEHLSTLYLNKNRLTDVPDCVFALINLRVLDISHNQIVSISDKILSFYRLEKLDVSYNLLKRLPYAFNRLHALTELSVQHNELTYLPNTIGSMRNLQSLNFLPNPFADIEEMDNCESLGKLLRFLRHQKIPKVYLDDARKIHTAEREKVANLTEDQRIFRELLKYKEGVQALEEWMKKEHSSENLLFYKAVRDFRGKYNSTVEIRTQELINDAKKIFDEFVSPNAPNEVNLPADATKDCIASFTDQFKFPSGINQWVFEPAYKASFDLMVRDSFQRFRLSDTGKELLKQLEKITKQKENGGRRGTADSTGGRRGTQ